jgi:hypothetical protein
VLIIIIAVSTIFAFAGYVIAGRVVGLGITALCSATMAFFLMPPLYSLRVSRSHDIVALSFYGTVGLVLAKTAPSKKKKFAAAGVDPVCIVAPRQGLETNLSLTVADLMSSDLGDRLRAVDFAVVGKGFTLPCSREETRRILSDVLTAALQTPEVKRVSIYGGARPAVSRLIVAAHCVWPPPLRRVITIGRRDEDCEPATFPGWPLHSGATWFDNGFDRIFQISVRSRAVDKSKLPALLSPSSVGCRTPDIIIRMVP